MGEPAPRRLTLIGLGLIGSSLARAVADNLPDWRVTGFDADPAVRVRARDLMLAPTIADTLSDAVADADLIVLCVPVGAVEAVARDIAPLIAPGTIVSDVGSSKQGVLDAMVRALPNARIVPAHPVAGTEASGPDAGFATLFQGRWCILTPPADPDADAVMAVQHLWEAVGARVEVMDAARHDQVLAVTSHLPHLIAYTIVGTASDLEDITQSDVIKYSAGGFRDFTRIAASDPVMWRDVFLANRDAVLDTLQRFTEDLSRLQRAIRWGDADTLEEWFTRTRAIRRSVIDSGQDDPAPDFGRRH